MKMISQFFSRVLKQWIQFGRGERIIFYELLINQLRLGIPVSNILGTVRRLDVSPEMTYICQTGEDLLQTGGKLSDALEKTGFFPVEDIGMLRLADERIDLLLEVLEELKVNVRENVGIFGRVVIPNIYFLVVLGVITFMVAQFESYEKMLSRLGDLSANDAYIVSVFINDYLFFIFLCIVLLIVSIWYIRTHGYGNIRRWIWIFDRDSRYNFGSRFCQLSSMMYRVGMSNKQVISISKEVFSHSRFMSVGLNNLYDLHIEQGMAYSVALGRTILDEKMAVILEGMTAGGARDLSADSFLSVGKIQNTLCLKFYSRLKVYLQLILGILIMYLIVTMFTGIYSVYG